VTSFTISSQDTFRNSGHGGGGGGGGGGSGGTGGNGNGDGTGLTTTIVVTTTTTQTKKTDDTTTKTDTTKNDTTKTDTTKNNTTTTTTKTDTTTQNEVTGTNGTTGTGDTGSNGTGSSGSGSSGGTSGGSGSSGGSPSLQPVALPKQIAGVDCSGGDATTTAGVLEGETRASYCQTVLAVSTTTKKLKTILESPKGGVVATATATTAAVSSGAVMISTALFLNPVSFSELFLIPIRLWTLLMTALGLKKRRRPWGTVYDSVTKQPLDPAYVTLRSIEGEDIASTLTDLDGRFGFVVPKAGQYSLIAKKTNYVFPSQKLVGRDHDELYRDLYFGEHFAVAQAGDVVIRNIPMDPEKFDWNEFAKKDQHLMKFYSRRTKVLMRITDVLFGLGFIVALIAVISAPRGYNIAVFALYIVLFFFRKIGLKARPFGGVVEAATGKPIAFSIVRVSSASTGFEIIHRITDAQGKYYCLLPNGAYLVRIDRKMPDGNYELIKKGITVTVTKGYLAETFEV
jgi:hypothetical protein